MDVIAWFLAENHRQYGQIDPIMGKNAPVQAAFVN